MPRTFVPISKDELKTLIEDTVAPYADEDDQSFRGKVLALMDENSQIKKDLKVSFDFENFECESGEGYNGCESITGPQNLDNGLSFIGCTAGGDWQVPVFFIVYWDGKKFRAYVPTDGNTWNTDTKTAYGDDAEADCENVKKRYPHLIPDIESQLESDKAARKRLGLSEDYVEFDSSGIVPDCDPVKMVSDIKGRIVTGSEEPGSVEMPVICDGFKVSQAGEFILIQPTQQGSVKGHGLMMTRDMAARVAAEIADLL